ncbi:hypothetical protein [Sediminibacillus massiliensis]|nr:hypothetical protein [Sediminibacillus massiliensis]
MNKDERKRAFREVMAAKGLLAPLDSPFQSTKNKTSQLNEQDGIQTKRPQ